MKKRFFYKRIFIGIGTTIKFLPNFINKKPKRKKLPAQHSKEPSPNATFP